MEGQNAVNHESISTAPIELPNLLLKPTETLAYVQGCPPAEFFPEPSSNSKPEPEYPSGVNLALITVALCLAVFLVGLDRTIITTAIPKITNEFNSLDDIAWYGSAYLLTSCSFQLIFGKIYSYISVKWTFLAAIGIFEAGSALCGASPNSIALIIGRAIAGLGCAGIISGALVIISLSMPLHKRPVYTGLIGAVNGIAMVVGPLLGGAFTDKITWRWCFYINLPIGAVTLVVITFLFKDPINEKAAAMTPMERRRQIDILGTLIFVPANVCLLLALQWGGSAYPWNSWRLILLFVLFGVLSVIWAIIQVKKGNLATLPPHIISQRSVACGVWSTFCLGSAVLLLTYFLPLWFQAIKDASATISGVDYLPTAVSVTVMSIGAGYITTAIGYYVPLMLTSSVLMSIGAGVMCTFKITTGSGLWITSQILFGAGAGMGIQQPMMAVQTVLDPVDIPVGIAAIIFAQGLGGAIFLSVGQSVFQNKLLSELLVQVPELDPEIVMSNGAWGLTSAIDKIGAQYVEGVLTAYNAAIVLCFVVGTVMAALSIIGALGMEWKSVKKNKGKNDNEVIPPIGE